MSAPASPDAGVVAAGHQTAADGAPRAGVDLLAWSFTLFNSLRVVSYLPTVWAIHTSRDSSQHALSTWLIWMGANLTMAAWLHRHNGGRIDRAVAVNVGNAVMCLATLLLIVFYRL